MDKRIAHAVAACLLLMLVAGCATSTTSDTTSSLYVMPASKHHTSPGGDYEYNEKHNGIGIRIYHDDLTYAFMNYDNSKDRNSNSLSISKAGNCWKIRCGYGIMFASGYSEDHPISAPLLYVGWEFMTITHVPLTVTAISVTLFEF